MLEVGLRAHVSALDAPLQQTPQLGEPDRDDPLLEGERKGAVGGEVGDEPLHHAAHERRATTFVKLLAGFAGLGSGRWCRACGKSIQVADDSGMAEAVCGPCREGGRDD
jgi:hypothetical protein